MNKREKQFYNVDWLLVGLYLILVTIGIFNIYSTEYELDANMFDFSHLYLKQVVWFGISLVVGFLIMLVDTRLYSYYATVGYVLLCVVLLSLIFWGHEINGAKSWISFGAFAIQPSEFAKIATALFLSQFLSRFKNTNINTNFNFYKVFLIILIPSVLIIGQNDFGSAFVFGALVLVLYRFGFSYIILVSALVVASISFSTILFGPLATTLVATLLSLLVYFYVTREVKDVLLFVLISFVAVVFLQAVSDILLLPMQLYAVVFSVLLVFCFCIIVYAWWGKNKNRMIVSLVSIILSLIPLSVNYMYDFMLKDYQRNRIDAFLGLKDDPSRINYNVIQSTIAIGSGGVWGKGYLQGPQTRFNFVPEQETDFIFCTIGEEWGFMGSTLFILLYMGLLVRLIYVAERQRDRMRKFYGYCVFAVLFIHFSINLSMTIGLFPVIGIPLPFISYGGSSLLAFTCLLFIFLNFDSNRMKFLKNS